MIYPRMNALFSYSLSLPDSTGSIVRFEPIGERVELQEDSDVDLMAFKEYRDVTPKNYGGKMEEMHTYIPVSEAPYSSVSFHGSIDVYVYRAAWIRTRFHKSDAFRKSHTDVCKRFVTLKLADNKESISELKLQVRRSLAVCGGGGGGGGKDRLLPVESCFMDEQSGKLCAVIFSPPHGSLRSIMKIGFPGGFSQDLIAIALRKILKALGFLHRQHILHRDINAGHAYVFHPLHRSIYYKSKISRRSEATVNDDNDDDFFHHPMRRSVYDDDNLFHPVHHSDNRMSIIGLGFAATVYEDEEEDDHDEDEETEPPLPMASMSTWAAAPEVYDRTQPYSDKADIWLVGITALELAYGGLKVASRTALEALIKEILDKKRLPDKTWVNPDTVIDEDIVQKAAADMAAANAGTATTRTQPESTSKQGYWKFLGRMSSLLYSDGDDNSFSETFTSMVLECLAWDPQNRPTVDKLLSHKFFKKGKGFWKSTKNGGYFYNVVTDKIYE